MHALAQKQAVVAGVGTVVIGDYENNSMKKPVCGREAFIHLERHAV